MLLAKCLKYFYCVSVQGDVALFLACCSFSIALCAPGSFEFFYKFFFITFVIEILKKKYFNILRVVQVIEIFR